MKRKVERKTGRARQAERKTRKKERKKKEGRKREKKEKERKAGGGGGRTKWCSPQCLLCIQKGRHFLQRFGDIETDICNSISSQLDHHRQDELHDAIWSNNIRQYLKDDNVKRQKSIRIPKCLPECADDGCSGGFHLTSHGTGRHCNYTNYACHLHMRDSKTWNTPSQKLRAVNQVHNLR